LGAVGEDVPDQQDSLLLMAGRYFYIKATGVPNRWRRLFTVVLCEVMVY